MKIEGGSLQCTAELGLQLGAGGVTTTTAPTKVASAGNAAAALRNGLAAAGARETPKRGPASWVVTAGKGEVPRPATGYAAPPAARAAPAAGAKATSVTSPLDFLRDSRLTAEEKLVLLLAQQQKDVEKEIDSVLKQAEAKSAQKQKSSGGVLGGLKVIDFVASAVPGLGLVEKTFGAGAISKAVSQLGGPLLAAAATALGAPQLAPIALSAGPSLISGVLDAEMPFGSAPEPRAVATNAPSSGAGSSTR